MERRLEIYNKIKNTKISKLTLKQNGEAKTLNLKVDLLNESVFLSDKALDMLENLANKQILSTEKIKPKQIETPQPLPQAINEQETIAAAAAAATNYETPISSQFFEENVRMKKQTILLLLANSKTSYRMNSHHSVNLN